MATQVEVSFAQFLVPDPVPMGPGCPPGSLWATFPALPNLGAPPNSANACKCETEGPVPPGPVTPLQSRLVVPCCPGVSAYSPPGTQPNYGSPVLDQLSRMLQRWRQQVQPDLPG